MNSLKLFSALSEDIIFKAFSVCKSITFDLMESDRREEDPRKAGETMFLGSISGLHCYDGTPADVHNAPKLTKIGALTFIQVMAQIHSK